MLICAKNADFAAMGLIRHNVEIGLSCKMGCTQWLHTGIASALPVYFCLQWC